MVLAGDETWRRLDKGASRTVWLAGKGPHGPRSLANQTTVCGIIFVRCVIIGSVLMVGCREEKCLMGHSEHGMGFLP